MWPVQIRSHFRHTRDDLVTDCHALNGHAVANAQARSCECGHDCAVSGR